MGNGLAATSGTGNGSSAPFISKSNYIYGLQCQRLLWHLVNASDQVPKPEAEAQAIFAQGHEVGAWAKKLYPDGIQVGNGEVGLGTVLSQSHQALKLRRPLFEAAFRSNGAFARADILQPVQNEAWDVVEVKSSTEVKEEHLQDLAFQVHVYTGAGLKIRRYHVLYINNDYVRKDGIVPGQLFDLEDTTAQVEQLAPTVEPQLNGMLATIKQASPPKPAIGPHCDEPYGCPLKDQCWSFLPEQNVLDLYRGKKKGFDFLERGILKLADIPNGEKLTANQAIQKQAAITGKPHVNKAAISTFLDRLQYPLYFLDFETFASAIPLIDGVRPYQQVPFQFSCHIQRKPGAGLEHRMFLAEGRNDPRPEFMLRLREAIGPAGSVVTFNASFERSRLKECCAALPEYAPWVAQVDRRIVDLLEPFRSFHYYHPRQRGSASIKCVLPALTGKDYKHLGIQDGGAATREFLRVTFGDVQENERQQVRRQLEEYCGLDTEGMRMIIQNLDHVSLGQAPVDVKR